MKPLGESEVWFVTGSQDLYGADALRQVAVNATEVAAAPGRQSRRSPSGSSSGRSSPRREAIAATCLEANAPTPASGSIAWMHTFSPARMWIAGLQALAKPLLHLHTQFNRDLPWGEIDMDFMNLHQAAHGDREFGYIETRLRVPRKTVVGHWQDPYVADRIGAWARAACAWREAHRLKVARFGDNMRHVADTEGDKVEAQIRLGVSVNGYGVSDLGARGPGRAGRRRRPTPRRPTPRAYELAPELGPEGARREELREAARIEAGLRGVPERRAGSGRSPTRSRTSTVSASCRASRPSG